MTLEKVHPALVLPTAANVAPAAKGKQSHRLTWTAKAAGVSLVRALIEFRCVTFEFVLSVGLSSVLQLWV